MNLVLHSDAPFNELFDYISATSQNASRQLQKPHAAARCQPTMKLLPALLLATLAAVSPLGAADSYDIVVYGGSSGGITAAIQAARMGVVWRKRTWMANQRARLAMTPTMAAPCVPDISGGKSVDGSAGTVTIIVPPVSPLAAGRSPPEQAAHVNERRPASQRMWGKRM